jgi:hypothetical protein
VDPSTSRGKKIQERKQLSYREADMWDRKKKQSCQKSADEDLSTTTDNFIKTARYVVPARRRIIAHSDKDVKLVQCAGNTSVLIGAISIQTAPKQEVKPTFRTPCNFMSSEPRRSSEHASSGFSLPNHVSACLRT